MPWYDKDAYDDEDDGGMWFDAVKEDDINVDEEFKTAEEYIAEYDE